MIAANDKTFLIQILTFWNKLDDKQKNIIFNNTVPIHYLKGSKIHNGEIDCIGVLLIKSGELRTYILSESGKEITLFRLSKNDICILSASCILDNITFDVHIDTETDCDILLINSAIYQQLCRQNIYAENFTYKITIDRFSDVMWAMEQILFMSFDQRLAVFLWDEITKNKSNIILMTHEQIAKYMGSAREVVSRMLKYFSEEGIVSLSRGGIKIIDKKKLKSLI